jgi:hypothetical protein
MWIPSGATVSVTSSSAVEGSWILVTVPGVTLKVWEKEIPGSLTVPVVAVLPEIKRKRLPGPEGEPHPSVVQLLSNVTQKSVPSELCVGVTWGPATSDFPCDPARSAWAGACVASRLPGESKFAALPSPARMAWVETATLAPAAGASASAAAPADRISANRIPTGRPGWCEFFTPKISRPREVRASLRVV